MWNNGKKFSSRKEVGELAFFIVVVTSEMEKLAPISAH
jgi:hypothetical protein